MEEREMHVSEGPACTYGRFEALLDEDMKSEADSSDRDDEGKDSDSSNDDAAYAFPDDGNSEEVDVIMLDETQSLNVLPPRGQRIAEPLSLSSDAALGMAEVTSGTEGKGSSSLDSEGTRTVSYTGSSAPTHSQDTAPTPGSDFPYSLASTSSDLRSDELAQPTPPLGQTLNPETPEAVEPEPEVEYVTTIAAARNPTQAAFGCHGLVSVPDAGQCAILAFYASVTNHDDGPLKLSPVVTKDVNIHNKAIYSLMLANLRTDALLGLIDPTQKLARLYPACPAPDSREVATALLFQHLLIERTRSVARRVPCAHWATSNALRTYAQYLRQPLLVLDVDANVDAHMQVYSYSHHAMPEGREGTASTHESGVCTVMTDAEASAYLQACGRLHVLPSLQLLKHHERHFYGVQHGERLDVVHLQRGMRIMDAVSYDKNHMEATMYEEEQLVYLAAGSTHTWRGRQQ
ncbi:hypothetical protein PInf_018125 [Phytophthora infestans]|nr:hypothetical protein PInf_018125 [Phytophthora infestans]